MNPHPHLLEALESRIAPAVLFSVSLDHKTAVWTDVDGDTVTLKASKGVLDAKDFTFLEQQPGEVGQQLALLDLSDAGAAGNGVSLTFTAKRTDRLGDGSVNIGRIDATGVDLGAVKIPGDLASIAAGDATLATPALGPLTVTSAGALGVATQGGGEAVLDWAFRGRIGAVTVKGDFFATLDVLDNDAASDFNADASTGAISIWGDLVGGGTSLSGTDLGSGYLFAEGNMGAVKIGGEIFGGSAAYGGSVSAIGFISSVWVGGNLFGTEAPNTASISGVLGKVTIGGSIWGGDAEGSGVVTSYGAMASVSVGGSIFGGSASNTGNILAYGPLGKVTVVGSVIGGDSPRDQDGFLFLDDDGEPVLIQDSGAIGSFVRIDSVTIRGDLVAGEGFFSGAIFTDANPLTLPAFDLATAGNIKSVTIVGTLQGFSFVDDGDGNFLHVPTGIYADGQLGAVKVGAIAGSDPLDPASIVALGKSNPANAGQALAIASVTVLRGAVSAEILAGFDYNGLAQNPDAQIGAIKIANSFVGSSISAGVPFTGDGFGDASNAIADAGAGFTDNPAIRSRIASLIVGGYVLGNPFGSGGFLNGAVAQEIGVVKIGAATLELTKANPFDVFAVGVNQDFIVREVV